MSTTVIGTTKLGATRLRRVKILIREHADGQSWCFVHENRIGTTLFSSAGEALNRAKSIGRRLAPSAVIVTWEPATVIGALAVGVLASRPAPAPYVGAIRQTEAKLRFVCLSCHAVIYSAKPPTCRCGCAEMGAPAATLRALEVRS